jgi:hypothetical protein
VFSASRQCISSLIFIGRGARPAAFTLEERCAALIVALWLDVLSPGFGAQRFVGRRLHSCLFIAQFGSFGFLFRSVPGVQFCNLVVSLPDFLYRRSNSALLFIFVLPESRLLLTTELSIPNNLPNSLLLTPLSYRQ